MSQTMAVHSYLKKHGSITPLQALAKLQCFRLAARVNDLRGKGIKVSTTMVKQGDKRFARYRLVR